MPSFVEIGSPVLEKKIFKGFYHIWKWWGGHLGHVTWIIYRIFEIVDGRTPDHGYPISSPCEPNGSGELKINQNIKIMQFCQNLLQTSQKLVR